MSNPERGPRDWQELLGGDNLARLILVCFGVWLHAADGLMVTTMMPSIIRDIGGARFVSWTISLYEIGSIVAGASGAFLCMRYSLRVAMTASALIYALGCAVSALAPEMWVALIGRLVQGLGGGGLMALSLISVSILFSRSLMPRVIGAVSALWGVSSFLGPLVGGVFADSGYWRGGFWFFAAQAAVLAGFIGFSTALRPNDAQVRLEGDLPIWRLSLLSLAVFAIAWAGIEVSFAETPLFIVLGFLLLALFLWTDGRRDSDRLLPRRPLDPRNAVGAALLMILSFSAATIAISAYGPILLTQLHGVSALTAGYIVAVSSVGWSVMAVLVSGADERHDSRLTIVGMSMLAISIVGFMLAIPYGPLWLVVVFAALEGFGFGMAWTFILRRVTILAPKSETERVSSALPTLQRLGYALGAAYTGVIANAASVADRMDRPTAQAVAFWIFAACLPLAAIGLFSTWRFVRLGKISRNASTAPPLLVESQ